MTGTAPVFPSGTCSSGVRIRSLRDLLEDPRALEPPRAVVPRLAWEGRTTLLVAREKVGKSTIAAAAAAAVSTGTAFLGDPVDAGSVLWVGLEEHVFDALRRFERFGAAPEAVHIVTELEDALGGLEEAVAITGAVMTVIDTLAAFAVEDVRDASASAPWTRVMGRLARIARDSNTALLLLHHGRRSDGDYRDSTAIGAGVDIIVRMREHKGDLAARTLDPRGRWDQEKSKVRLGAEGFALVGGTLPSAAERMDAAVTAFVTEHPRCSRNIVRREVGGRHSDVDASISRLLAGGVIANDESPGGQHHYVIVTMPVNSGTVPSGHTPGTNAPFG